MATTAKGTPYVVSTDLVANYPTVSSDLADHIDDNLAYNAVSINAQTGTTYTFALADASEGKLVTASNAAASTYTVPPQSSVTWAAGAVLRILNQGAGTVTVAAGAGVTINGTPLTLAQYKGAAIQRTAADTWTFIPFSGGVGNANFSDTPTGTYTGYKYITYTASGTLNVTTAGFADVLTIGGGGGGGTLRGGGGGAGGHNYQTNFYLPVGSLTVTVGAGGIGAQGTTTDPSTGAGAPGSPSSLGGLVIGLGGGGGGSDNGGYGIRSSGGDGGSGGGTGSHSSVWTPIGGTGLLSQGNNGGNSTNDRNNGGGGGGAGAAGSNGTSNVGGAGGNGTANSITGSSVTRAGGGGGGGGTTGGTGGTGGGGAGGGNAIGTAGTANTGGGGGGAGSNVQNVSGGSGVVIVRVAV